MGLEHTRRLHDIKKKVANVLPDKLARRWEDRIRSNTLEKSGLTGLNEMVSFNIEPSEPDEVAIHIHENLTRTPIQTNKLIIEGLKLLALRLREDPELANIAKISGYSWIVYNSPDILRRLGFSVSGFNHVNKMALATMDRQTFIGRFGS